MISALLKDESVLKKKYQQLESRNGYLTAVRCASPDMKQDQG